MRIILSAICLAAFAAAPALAGLIEDRPDLEDVYSWFYSDSPDYNATNRLTVRQNEDTNTADGGVEGYTDGRNVEIWWNLYEPDKVSRSSKKQKLDQGAFLSAGFSSWTWSGSSTWDGALVEDCKASTAVSLKDGNTTGAKWKMACDGLLAALGLSQAQLARIDAALGRYVNVDKDKVKISGKVKFD